MTRKFYLDEPIPPLHFEGNVKAAGGRVLIGELGAVGAPSHVTLTDGNIGTGGSDLERPELALRECLWREK